MIQSLAKTVAVVASTTILSTLAVNAMDIQGPQIRSMLSAVFFGLSEEAPACPADMVEVAIGLEPFCIDRYEASARTTCPYSDPGTVEDTALNLAHDACTPVSEVGRVPWRHVTQADARAACARVSKRLPTPREWYLAALGTPDPASGLTDQMCQVAENRTAGVSPTGTGMRCVSDAGVYDMIGNVWEWVDAEVVAGVWNNHVLPTSGRVSGVGLDGVPVRTEDADVDLFQGDRLWLDSTITAGMLRGGYFDSGVAAGLHAVYAASPPAFSGEAVGFRCVADVHSHR